MLTAPNSGHFYSLVNCEERNYILIIVNLNQVELIICLSKIFYQTNYVLSLSVLFDDLKSE